MLASQAGLLFRKSASRHLRLFTTASTHKGKAPLVETDWKNFEVERPEDV